MFSPLADERFRSVFLQEYADVAKSYDTIFLDVLVGHRMCSVVVINVQQVARPIFRDMSIYYPDHGAQLVYGSDGHLPFGMQRARLLVTTGYSPELRHSAVVEEDMEEENKFGTHRSLNTNGDERL